MNRQPKIRDSYGAPGLRVSMRGKEGGIGLPPKIFSVISELSFRLVDSPISGRRPARLHPLKIYNSKEEIRGKRIPHHI